MTACNLIDALLKHFETTEIYNPNLFESKLLQCNSLKKRCSGIERIIHAMKYYKALNTEAKQSEESFIEFCTQTYTLLLDDFIHIIQIHTNDLEHIINHMWNEYGIEQCHINNCTSLLRHYENDNQKISTNTNSSKNDNFIFYRNTMDSIHCYFFHSYDIGLRVKQYDNSFSNMRDIISTKTKQFEKINSLNQCRFANNKFNLNINMESKDDDITYIDGLYEYVIDNGIETLQLESLKHLLLTEEYDTDALYFDIDQFTEKSNIATVLSLNDEKFQSSTYDYVLNENSIQTIKGTNCICGSELIRIHASKCYGYHNTVSCDLCGFEIEGSISVYHCDKGKITKHPKGFDICVACFDKLHVLIPSEKVTSYALIQQYIQHSRLSEYSFSVGYRFYYWSFYKDNKTISQRQPTNNKNDHCGYEAYELYIEARYQSLKDEILNNKHCELKIEQFMISLKKAQEFIQTIVAKQCSFVRSSTNTFDIYKVYGIDDAEPLKISNLLSVILYCDWTVLCREFSKTFRKTKWYESITKIKEKNREFAIWSRILRETVELYGENGLSVDVDDDGNETYTAQGPFYTGMSFVMVVPEFHIRLCSPTSTSTKMAVAIRFGGDEGIVIQLNNKQLGKNLCCFNCSWLSNYTAEDERLFFGGAHRIQIENIRNIKTAENFECFLNPLYYFHCMMNGMAILSGYELGSWLTEEVINNTHVMIINNLIKHNLGTKGFKNDYSHYINDTFKAFVNHQTQIVLDLFVIDIYFDKFQDLIIQTSDGNKINDMIFKLFKNMNSLIIITTASIG
eukprot:451211_1